MKMYHVNVDIFKNIKVFIPRVPKSRMKNEDSITPRVCISNSIENCLSGLTYMSKYWKFITNDLETNFSLLDEVCLRVLKVYEFEVEDSIITPEELNAKDLVPDASTTNEYWSLKEIVPTNSYLIGINDIYEDNFRISKLDYDIIDINDVSREAKIHFNEIGEDIKELFENKEYSSLCYSILDIQDNVISISTNSYPVKKDDLYTILDKYFSWSNNHIKTVV